MAGACVIKLGHACGSRDALQVFENEDKTLSGYCFACDTYVAHPYGVPKTIDDIPKEQRLSKSREEIAHDLEEIEGYKTFDLVERRLRASSLDYFDVKIGLSEIDGRTPRLVYFPYTKDGEIVRYKARLLGEKRMWNISLDTEVDLFGWEQALKSGAKRLIITEGEYDAIAGYSILNLHQKEEYKNSAPAFVSLPNGAATAAKDLLRLSKKIKKTFPEVSLCFDSDAAGRKAIQDVLKIFPEATLVELPGEKDLNDCIINGKSKAAYAAIIFRHEKQKSTRLVRGTELSAAARIRPEMGLSWPWEGFTHLTRGIRRGETYYFGSGVKMGKSELVNAIADHIIRVHGNPVLLCKPEEDKVKTYQMLVGKAAGKIFHDPEMPFDEEAFDIASDLIGDKAIIVDNYQFVDWKNLKEDVRYAVASEGVHDIIIDPITCFTSGMSSSDTNEFLIGMSAELAALSKELQFTAYIFCHLKAPENGPPHERGGQVLSTQFTGSRAMMRSCNMMIGMEGNKDPELPELERNIRKLKILEDRNLGASGLVKLFWNKNTGLFAEME
jgi:twinkle protein